MTKRFCCFVNLIKGCYLLGISTFLLSALMSSVAITSLTLEDHGKEPSGLTANMENRHVLNLSLDRRVKHLILGTVLLMGILWMVFSLMFIYGIRKNKPSCVVSYFLFGIAISIMFLLSAVLAMLNKKWRLALSTCVLTVAYIRCLASVLHAYDRLQQGQTLGDVEHLISEEDFNADD